MSCGRAKLPDASATSQLPTELLTAAVNSVRPQRWVRGSGQAMAVAEPSPRSREPVVIMGLDGDVVMAAAHTLHEGMTGGEDPR